MPFGMSETMSAESPPPLEDKDLMQQAWDQRQQEILVLGNKGPRPRVTDTAEQSLGT